MTEERPESGRERLLAAAVRHLETHGEADLRVTDIAAEAGVAIGLIRHHFGGRDGLVSAAQERRVEGATRVDILAARAAITEADDSAALLQRLRGLTQAIVDGSRAEVRLSRFAAIAAAHGRPATQESIGAALGDLLDELTVLLLEAQVRGLMRRDLDARAIGTFIQAYSLGLIVHDLDPKQTDPTKLIEVILAALSSFIDPSA